MNENSLDSVSRHVIESISDTSSEFLQKTTEKDSKSFQAYTIRRLDQKQSSLLDTDNYKLVKVEETALSNKLKHLDVLCFPTLFPSGKFGECHPRKVPISPSEFVKSRLLNKDSHFR